MDTSERDALMRQLEDEKSLRRRAQEKEAKLLLTYNLALAELNLLREEIFKIKDQTLLSTPQKFHVSDLRFLRGVSMDIGTQLRCLDFDAHLEMFVMGANRNIGGQRNMGLAKVSLLDSTRVDMMNNTHEHLIKCVSCSPFSDGLVLTTSFDKLVKLSSLNTNTALLSYTLDSPGWSCTFNPDNRNCIFSGSASGHVYSFDIRNTKTALWNIPVPSKSGALLPIHSIHSTKSTEVMNQLLLANSLGPSILNVSSDGAVDMIDYPDFKSIGQCGSVIYDRESFAWVASYRGTPSYYKYGFLSLDGENRWTKHQTFNCNQIQTCMVRPAILNHESQSLLVLPDGLDARVSLITSLGDELEHRVLPTNGHFPTLETVAVRASNKIITGLLSERQLNLYRGDGPIYTEA